MSKTPKLMTTPSSPMPTRHDEAIAFHVNAAKIDDAEPVPFGNDAFREGLIAIHIRVRVADAAQRRDRAEIDDPRIARRAQ